MQNIGTISNNYAKYWHNIKYLRYWKRFIERMSSAYKRDGGFIEEKRHLEQKLMCKSI